MRWTRPQAEGKLLRCNAPLLAQSLIGAPEAPNPLARQDDWPKMPKVDWNAATLQDHGLLGPQTPMTPEQGPGEQGGRALAQSLAPKKRSANWPIS